MTRIAVALIGVAALAGLLYTLSRIDDVAIEPEAADNRLPRYTLTDATLSRYDKDGVLALRATAATLEYFDDESAKATTLTLDLLSGKTTPWKVEAPTGSLKAGTRELLLDGNVVANGNWPDNGEPVVLRSPHMTVNQDSHELSSDVVVTAESRSRKGSGIGMNANWTQHDLRLLNNVKMRYEATR